MRVKLNILEKEKVEKMIKKRIAKADEFYFKEINKLRDRIVELEKIVSYRANPIIKRGKRK